MPPASPLCTPSDSTSTRTVITSEPRSEHVFQSRS